MGQLVAVTPPSILPVTTQEVADHLNADEPQLDELHLLLESAVSYLDGPDGILNRCLMSQTWDYKLDAFPSGTATAGPWAGIQLPISMDPLQSVTHVKYLDPDGVEQTWANTEYTVDRARRQVYPNYGVSYPTTRTGSVDVVTVRCVAGYTLPTVPAADKLLVLWLVAQWYEHREPVVVGQTAVMIPEGIDRLINARRRWSVA